MITEVTTSILDLLEADGLDVRQVDFKDLIDRKLNLTRPAVNISINMGDAEQVTLTTYKMWLQVSLIVVFQHLKDEAHRKEGVFAILDAMNASLVCQRPFGMMENILIPVSFRNVTTSEYSQAGCQLYELKYKTSVTYTYNDRLDDFGTLKGLLLKYYLQPRDYTGMIGVSGPEASDMLGYTGLNA
jgi:hypothetical protein